MTSLNAFLSSTYIYIYIPIHSRHAVTPSLCIRTGCSSNQPIFTIIVSNISRHDDDKLIQLK